MLRQELELMFISFGNEWIRGESFIESPLDELQNNLSLEIIGFCLDR